MSDNSLSSSWFWTFESCFQFSSVNKPQAQQYILFLRSTNRASEQEHVYVSKTAMLTPYQFVSLGADTHDRDRRREHTGSTSVCAGGICSEPSDFGVTFFILIFVPEPKTAPCVAHVSAYVCWWTTAYRRFS